MRRFTLIALVLFASVLAFPLTAQAAPVLVSQFGNDTLGDGSLFNPFATVQRAMRPQSPRGGRGRRSRGTWTAKLDATPTCRTGQKSLAGLSGDSLVD